MNILMPALRCTPAILHVACVWLGLAMGAHAAGAPTVEVCAGGNGRYGPANDDGGSRYVVERFICQLSTDAPAKPLEFVGAAERIVFAPPVDIAFQPLPGAALVDLPGAMELVDTLNFSEPPKIDFATFSNLAQPASLIVGDSAVWTVTPGGVRVFDAKTQRWSFSAKLSSDQVRPHDVVLDEKGGNVWFFGRELYQYEIASHKIYRYKPAAKPFRTIRKLAAVAGDLWLATDGGAFFFDTKRKVLAQLQTTAKLPTQLLTQVAVSKNVVWFGSGDAQLLRVVRDGGNLSAQVSKSLGKVAAIELLAREDGLWLLHSQDLGRSYQLATVPQSSAQLLVSKNTLYNLRESDGQVLASAYDKLFRADTANRALHPIFADVANIGAMTLGNRVMFSGTSYVNSRGTGSVARYVLDLSKGWQQPASRVIVEAWGLNQAQDMFDWSPALLETGANAREIWFLVAGNLTDAKMDRSFVARYDKRSKRAQVFFSRWAVDVAASQPFVVESATTQVDRKNQ